MASLRSPLFFCLILIILNTFDAITTVYGLSIGRIELNQVTCPQNSMPIKIALPFVYLGFLYMASKFCDKKGFRMGLTMLKVNALVLVIFYSAICVNNLIVIFWGMV